MAISIDILFRALTLLIFFSWWSYWYIAEREAEREKPREKGIKPRFRRWIVLLFEGILVLQLFGLTLLPLPWSTFIMQMIGFIFVMGGAFLSILARKIIGINWAPGYEYQVKKNQELVTTGIYAYIRHPIYSGLCLALLGGELVAQSYLVLAMLPFLIANYWQARQEEKLLAKYFGSIYKNYMKRTKMFIPYLW